MTEALEELEVPIVKIPPDAFTLKDMVLQYGTTETIVRKRLDKLVEAGKAERIDRTHYVLK